MLIFWVEIYTNNELMIQNVPSATLVLSHRRKICYPVSAMILLYYVGLLFLDIPSLLPDPFGIIVLCTLQLFCYSNFYCNCCIGELIYDIQNKLNKIPLDPSSGSRECPTETVLLLRTNFQECFFVPDWPRLLDSINFEKGIAE